MALLPTLPKELEHLIDRKDAIAVLRGTAGYQEFLDALGELRASNYLDILTLTSRDEIISAVGEARALWKVRNLVDDSVQQGVAIAAELDAQVEALRQRDSAAQRTFTPRPDTRRWRPAPIETR